MKFLCANRIAPDGTPCSATSHLGLFCLPMSHKMDARLIWVKMDFSFVSDRIFCRGGGGGGGECVCGGRRVALLNVFQGMLKFHIFIETILDLQSNKVFSFIYLCPQLRRS